MQQPAISAYKTVKEERPKSIMKHPHDNVKRSVSRNEQDRPKWEEIVKKYSAAEKHAGIDNKSRGNPTHKSFAELVKQFTGNVGTGHTEKGGQGRNTKSRCGLGRK